VWSAHAHSSNHETNTAGRRVWVDGARNHACQGGKWAGLCLF
jgi:hypothetical protein